MRVPCIRLGLGQCPAPCGDLVEEAHYSRRVELARTFLREGKATALEQIDAERSAAPTEWEALLLADVRSRLLRLGREYRPL
jgi:excinuclease UvrABC nuclease subunit